MLRSFYGHTENFAGAVGDYHAAEIPNLNFELIRVAEGLITRKKHPVFRQGRNVRYEFVAEDEITRLFLVLSATAL